MANASTTELGWNAHNFALEGVDGKTYALKDVRGEKGTLVAFICNHCPYVKAIVGRLIDEAKALEAMREIAETGRGPKQQMLSAGCSIKWRGDVRLVS